MSRYLKDKKVTIYQKTEFGYDESGYPLPEGVKPIHPGKLWAYARHLSAKEFWEAGIHSEVNQEERFFVVNWRDDITAEMMIQYKDSWFNIVRVDSFEDYKEDIKLYVKTAVPGDIPDDTDILPYE